jgi:hypothetical protein
MQSRTLDEILEYEQAQRDREQVIRAANELALKLEGVDVHTLEPCS